MIAFVLGIDATILVSITLGIGLLVTQVINNST